MVNMLTEMEHLALIDQPLKGASMTQSHTGLMCNNVLLGIGNAIAKKERREERSISDCEAHGLAMTIQGRYGYVQPEETELFCKEVVRAFNYVKQRELTSVSTLAHLRFKVDETLGVSPLHDEFDPGFKPT
jgi:hypothetical protein